MASPELSLKLPRSPSEMRTVGLSHLSLLLAVSIKVSTPGFEAVSHPSRHQALPDLSLPPRSAFMGLLCGGAWCCHHLANKEEHQRGKTSPAINLIKPLWGRYKEISRTRQLIIWRQKATLRITCHGSGMPTPSATVSPNTWTSTDS